MKNRCKFRYVVRKKMVPFFLMFIFSTQCAAVDLGIVAAIGKMRQYALRQYQGVKIAMFTRLGYLTHISLKGPHNLILPNDNQMQVYSFLYGRTIEAGDPLIKFFANQADQDYDIPLSRIMAWITNRVPIVTSSGKKMILPQGDDFLEQLVRLILFAQHSVSVETLSENEIEARITKGIIKIVSPEKFQDTNITYALSAQKINNWLHVLEDKSGFKQKIFYIMDNGLFFPSDEKYERAKKLLNNEDILPRMPFITIATGSEKYEIPVSEVYENIMGNKESIIIDGNIKLIPLFLDQSNKIVLFNLISNFVKNPDISHLKESIGKGLWQSWMKGMIFQKLKEYEKNLSDTITYQPE